MVLAFAREVSCGFVFFFMMSVVGPDAKVTHGAPGPPSPLRKIVRLVVSEKVAAFS